MPAMRLQRALARSGIASRRKAEELIRQGQVRVNGSVAEIGMSVDPTRDVVEVGGRRIEPVATTWIALHKPVGYVVTRSDKRGRPTVFELVPPIPGLTYVGRLDVNTSGLLLMTTDGDAVHALTHPSHGVERRYRVRARGFPVADIRKRLAKPISVDGKVVQIISAQVRQCGKTRSCDIILVLIEGRNRIVRRICKTIGLRVERLVRLSHGPIDLGALKCGQWRYLSRVERSALAREVS